MLPLRCGEYQLKALIGRAPRGGILQLSIDGEHVGTFDFFAEQKERDMSWEKHAAESLFDQSAFAQGHSQVESQQKPRIQVVY